MNLFFSLQIGTLYVFVKVLLPVIAISRIHVFFGEWTWLVVKEVTDFVCVYIKPPSFLPFSQRWVSEKLSVESLRDLELFGGELSSPASHAYLFQQTSPAWALFHISRVNVNPRNI